MKNVARECHGWLLRSVLMSAGCVVILSACGGGSSTTTIPPTAPVAGSSGAALPAQKFDPSSVHVTTVTIPATDTIPEFLSVDAGGAVYFGSTGETIPGSCLYVSSDGSKCPDGGGAGLFRYNAGTFKVGVVY